MAKLIKKSVAKAEPVEVKPVEEVKRRGRPKMENKTVEKPVATVTTKEEKPAEKTAKAAQKTAQQEPVASVLAETIKTSKSVFNKVEVKSKEDLAEGMFVFADEGNKNPSVFKLVYVGTFMYMVDITSKDADFEGFIALDIKDVVEGKMAGVPIAVYEKE